MTDESGTHYHKYATRSEHNTSPPPVPSCRSPTTATVQRHDQALIPNARLDTMDCWMFFGQCLFVLQAAFVKSRKSLSTSSGVRYPRAE